MTEQPSRRVGTAELRAHTSRASLWLVLNGHVYDVSSFQFDHPGGKRVLLEHAGTDATQPFVSLHSPKAYALLAKLCVGVYDAHADDGLREASPRVLGAPADALPEQARPPAEAAAVRLVRPASIAELLGHPPDAASAAAPTHTAPYPELVRAHSGEGAPVSERTDTASSSASSSDVGSPDLLLPYPAAPNAASAHAVPAESAALCAPAPSVWASVSAAASAVVSAVASVTISATHAAPSAAAATAGESDRGDGEGDACPHPLSATQLASGARCPFAPPPRAPAGPVAQLPTDFGLFSAEAAASAEAAMPATAAAAAGSNGAWIGTGSEAAPPPPSLLPSAVSSERSADELTLTGGVRTEAPASVPLWAVGERGFLPVRDPLVELPGQWGILCDLVNELPMICADRAVRETLLGHSGQLYALGSETALAQLDSAEALERAHSLYGYLACAYVHGDKEDDGKSGRVAAAAADEGADEQSGGELVEKALSSLPSADVLPAYLAIGWCNVAKRLGRRPMLDYAACVLYNWDRVDRSGPISMANVRLLNRFTGLVDEEWFFKTHIVIESEAAGVVHALLRGLDALGADSDEPGDPRPNGGCGSLPDPEALLQSLRSLEGALWRVARVCLPIMFERAEGQGALCDYSMFYHRLRHFISGFEVVYEGVPEMGGGLRPVKLPGPSGAMSALLPTVDAFLGISMSNDSLAKLLNDFEACMPREHAAIIRRVRARRPPLRTYICKLLAAKVARENLALHEGVGGGGGGGVSVAGDCLNEGEADADALVSTYNECINRVLDFRWRHFQLVQKYIIDQARGSSSESSNPMSGGRGCPLGTGGTPAFEYLHQHIHDTEVARIRRPRASGHLSPSATASPLVVAGMTVRSGVSDFSPSPFALSAADGAKVASLDSSAAEVWAITGANGLLPTHAPLQWKRPQDAPGGEKGFGVLVSLARAIPSLSVGTGLYQALVEKHLPALQRCADLCELSPETSESEITARVNSSEQQQLEGLHTAHARERARSLCAHVCAAYLNSLHALRRPTEWVESLSGEADSQTDAQANLIILPSNNEPAPSGGSSTPSVPSTIPIPISVTGTSVPTQGAAALLTGERQTNHSVVQKVATTASALHTAALPAAAATAVPAAVIPVAVPETPAMALPPALASLLANLSKLVGRPARLDFVDLALYNWAMHPALGSAAVAGGKGATGSAGDESGGSGAGESEIEAITMENAHRLKLVCRFLAIPEEDTFWRLHIVLEAEARAMVAAILHGQAAMQAHDTRGLIDSLEHLAVALARLSECHSTLFADGGRRDVVLARRMRPFLLAGVGELQDMQLGCLYYSPRSAILPMALLFLGVRHAESYPLLRSIQKSIRSMPLPHRSFLASLEGSGGGDVRSHLHQIADRTPVHELALLEAGFNGCIEELLRYCSRRSHLVCRAFPHIAESFREYSHRKLEASIHQARCKLMLQRRVLGGPGPRRYSAEAPNQHELPISEHVAKLPAPAAAGALGMAVPASGSSSFSLSTAERAHPDSSRSGLAATCLSAHSMLEVGTPLSPQPTLIDLGPRRGSTAESAAEAEGVVGPVSPRRARGWFA